jgi:hypothetical protein
LNASLTCFLIPDGDCPFVEVVSMRFILHAETLQSLSAGCLFGALPLWNRRTARESSGFLRFFPPSESFG